VRRQSLQCVSPASSIFSTCNDARKCLNVRCHVSEDERFNREARTLSSTHVARQIAPHVASVNASIKQRGEQRFQPNVERKRLYFSVLLPIVCILLCTVYMNCMVFTGK